MIHRLLLALVAFAMMVASIPAAAQAPAADPSLIRAVDGLVAILDGRGDYDAYFAPAFKTAFPPAQLEEVARQLKATLGKPGAATPLPMNTAAPPCAWRSIRPHRMR